MAIFVAMQRKPLTDVCEDTNEEFQGRFYELGKDKNDEVVINADPGHVVETIITPLATAWHRFLARQPFIKARYLFVPSSRIVVNGYIHN